MERTSKMNEILNLIERNKQGKREYLDRLEIEEKRIGHKLRGGAKGFYNMVIRGYDERIVALRSILKEELSKAK